MLWSFKTSTLKYSFLHIFFRTILQIVWNKLIRIIIIVDTTNTYISDRAQSTCP